MRILKLSFLHCLLMKWQCKRLAKSFSAAQCTVGKARVSLLLPRIFLCYFMNLNDKYFEKIFSALCVIVFPKIFRIFPNFDISWYMTKNSKVHLKTCLLIETCSTSSNLYNLVGLVGVVLASYTGDPRTKSWKCSYFLYSNKTPEYSEIYHEQLTSEPFLPYNYRSSTLPRISRNIGRLLRQCGVGGGTVGLIQYETQS
jgi:hypothetical protein